HTMCERPGCESGLGVTVAARDKSCHGVAHVLRPNEDVEINRTSQSCCSVDELGKYRALEGNGRYAMPLQQGQHVEQLLHVVETCPGIASRPIMKASQEGSPCGHRR